MIIKNRIELAKYFAGLGFKKGVEVGACFGYYSEILCKNIPDLQLVAVDNWNNSRNSSREKKAGISGEEATKAKLAPYNAAVIKKNSVDAALDVPDKSLDFVFIDADHKYGSVKKDLEAWTKKVRPGGIVSGHDYYIFPSGNRGVIDAVNEFVAKYNYALNIIDWDKQNPNPDDRLPCWYFIKT
jgi:predicted O-methyltransferase YrrM